MPKEELSCPLGQYLSKSDAEVGLGSCNPCPPGQFSGGGTIRNCEPCPAGSRKRRPLGSWLGYRNRDLFWQLRSTGTPRVLRAGKFQDQPGGFGCISCDNLGDFYQASKQSPNLSLPLRFRGFFALVLALVTSRCWRLCFPGARRTIYVHRVRSEHTTIPWSAHRRE